MRLRHIPGSEELMRTSPFVIQNPEEHRGHYNEIFGNDNPIEIEVGMGKGKFIMELAAIQTSIILVSNDIPVYCFVLCRSGKN